MVEPTLPSLPELNKQAVRDKLAPLLLELGTTRIPGSRLAPLIDLALPPGTNYRLFIQERRPANLRAFVEKFLDGLVEPTAEKSGTDPVYHIPSVASAKGVIRTYGKLWKSFAAINPSKQLFLDRSTSELNVRDLSAPASPNAPTVRSLSIEEFEAMRVQFLEGLGEGGEITPELKALLMRDPPASYQAWIAGLKSTTPRLDRRWQEFRRESILHFFDLRLTDLEVHRERIEELKVQLIRDYEQIHTGKLEAAQSVKQDIAALSSSGSKEFREKQAREILHAAVDRMTMEQIQGVNIPFSVVMELIKHLPQ